ncbi:MAG: flavodoxin family protein [Thermoplasmata archaeon]|nr:flavodoxin family protein [Thermoplasmata archaeon]
MKILMIEGSPHKNGTSNTLAAEFIKGAESAGHTVETVDAVRSKIGGCLGCNVCQTGAPCVQKDGMEEIIAKMRECDMLVLTTPMYYFGFSAQLKAVIDRFYPLGSGRMAGKKSALIVAQYNPDEAISESLKTAYKGIASYMGFEDKGIIVAAGCGSADDLRGTDLMKKAYDFGRSL